MSVHFLWLCVVFMLSVTGVSTQTPAPSASSQKSEKASEKPPEKTSEKTADQSASKPEKLVDKAPPAKLGQENIPPGTKIYVSPLNGFESFLVAAFVKKGTPIVVVNSREKADYEITGVSETVQAGWAKMLFLGSQQSNEQASIVMTNLKTGEVVWGYNVNKSNSFKGKQSSSEACAKHLKARIERK